MIQDKNSKRTQNDLEHGFTIIELSMSLVFIAFIIVFLSSTLINVMATYNTGIWMNQVNAAARQINSDLADQTRFGSSVTTASAGNGPINRLCVGGVAYLWNVGDDDYNRFTGSNQPSLRLVRATNPNPVNNVDYCNNPDEEPDRNHASVQVLLGANVDILRFNVTRNNTQSLVNFDVVFATTGSNRPQPYEDSFTCIDGAGPNPFCAFTELNFSIFRRNRE